MVARGPALTTPIRTVERDEVSIAYQVTGRGLLDLLVVHDFAGHLRLDWELPGAARLFELLGSFARVIRFDRRGTGLSSRDAVVTGADADADDALAVLDDAGAATAALFAWGDGTPAAVLLAARRPERISALVVLGGYASPPRPLADAIDASERLLGGWGERVPPGFAPAADDGLRRWWTVRARAAATPPAARALVLTAAQANVREEAARVTAPTLVLHRAGDETVPSEHGRALAAIVPGARFVELAGDAHLPYVDPDQVAAELEAFLTGSRPREERPRGLEAYELEGELGRGGMGTVHLAQDRRLHRKVAVKLLPPELAGDETYRERFLREQRLAAALEHPNVVPIYDAGEADGRLYLVMRHIEGSDLRRVLDAGPLDPVRAVRILEQVAEALDAAHARGLVHRDVKPGNVLLDASGHAYLCDFGLTKEAATGPSFTATGQLVGTLDYLAPEQIRGGELDGRADVYALGCVLYECLVGRAPFGGRTEAQTLWGHMQEEAPPPSALRSGVPAQLDAVLSRALAKEPDDRYATAGALAGGARAALGLEAPAVIRRRRRWARVAFAAGVAILALALAAVLFEVARGDGAGPPSVEPDSLAALDPATGAVVADVPVGSVPTQVVAGEGAVWALNSGDGTVSKVDLATRRVVRTFAAASKPFALASGAGAIWIGEDDGVVERVEPAVGSRTPIQLPRWEYEEVAVAVGGGHAWSAVQRDNLARIDLRSLAVDASAAGTPATGSPGGTSLAVGAGSVWIGDGRNTIWRRDARTLRRRGSISVGRYPSHIALGGGWLWVTMPLQDVVWQIDPGSLQLVRTIEVGSLPLGVTYAGGAAWVASGGDGTVSRIDGRTHGVRTIPVGGSPRDVVLAGGLVWVAVT